jgi:hypothetical protein
LFYGRKQFFVWFFQGPADQLENENLEAAMPTTIIPFYTSDNSVRTSGKAENRFNDPTDKTQSRQFA